MYPILGQETTLTLHWLFDSWILILLSLYTSILKCSKYILKSMYDVPYPRTRNNFDITLAV